MKTIRSCFVAALVAVLALSTSALAEEGLGFDPMQPLVDATVEALTASPAELTSSRAFSLCTFSEISLELKCGQKASTRSNDGKHRLPASEAAGFQVAELNYSGRCWVMLPENVVTATLDLDTLPRGCKYGDSYDSVAWTVPSNPLVRIAWLPRELPVSTPVLVTKERHENEVPRYRSYAELVQGKEAWTIQYDDLDHRFVAEARPEDTMASFESVSDGLKVVAEQTNVQVIVRRFAAKKQIMHGGGDNDYWRQVAGVAWDYRWAWDMYVMSPSSVRQTLVTTGATIVAKFLKEAGTSPDVVEHFVTGLTWDEVASTDPTLMQLPEWKDEDGSFTARTGLTMNEAYARLFWRRRGKEVFLVVQQAFKAEFGEAVEKKANP